MSEISFGRHFPKWPTFCTIGPTYLPTYDFASAFTIFMRIRHHVRAHESIAERVECGLHGTFRINNHCCSKPGKYDNGIPSQRASFFHSSV
ncbi:hypothetical protein NPIL_21181 [Nephila pilipes]|uniref:Uncharacterized protein n=1 Tax=Nephila pilipes TaxID=299642 RepID=A0A8X6PPR9_NEPPI|nr:hypothetical protein NPIL_21181 [Nephila pilipes]